MGNQQSSEVTAEPIKLTINGVTKKYPVKNYETYEELPQEFKDNLIKTIKEDIKSSYEKYGNELGLHFFHKRPYEFWIVNDTFFNIKKLTILYGILPELKTYCKTLFGPNVPYCIDYNSMCGCYKITFIHNI